MKGTTPSKLTPALIGGGVLGVATAALNFIATINPILGCLRCACCLLAVGGGLLAAAVYLKDAAPSPEASYGDGALVGLLAGAFGSVFSTLLGIPLHILSSQLGWMPDISDLESLFEGQGQDVPPFLQDMVEKAASGELTVFGVLLGLVMSLLVFSAFSAIGGAIGAAVFHKKSA